MQPIAKHFLLNCKNALYTYQVRTRGKEEADKIYSLLFTIALFPFYGCILVLAGVIMYRFQIPFPAFFKTNIFGFFLGVIITHLPAWYYVKAIYRLSTKYPPEIIENNRKVNWYMFAVMMIFLSGPLLCVVIAVVFARPPA